MARFSLGQAVRPVPGQNGGQSQNGANSKVRVMVLEPGSRAADRAGVPTRRCTGDSQLWLAMLVSVMQDASRPECRALPCSRSTFVQLRAQLALPAQPYPVGAAAFSRRN
jgi:hypothetical protein